MAYVKQHFKNNEAPAINADALNHIEQGIVDASGSPEVIIVADNISDITTTADNIENINKVGNNIIDINVVAANEDDIDKVVENISDINTTVDNIDDINKVVANISDINVVAANEDDIDKVVANISDINTTVDNIDDINKVVANISDINVVAANEDDINKVSDNIIDINIISDDLAGEWSHIEDNGLITQPVEGGVGGDSKVSTVADNIDDVIIVADNIDDIKDAYNNSKITEAAKLTADSYATEAEDVFVKVYTWDAVNEIIVSTDTTEYSSLHWAAKSEGSVADVEDLVAIQDARIDPTGFDRNDLDTFPIIEFCVDATLGTYKRIDRLGNFSIITSDTFGDGVTALVDRTVMVRPDIDAGIGEFSYWYMGSKITKTVAETIQIANVEGKHIITYNDVNLMEEVSVEDAILDDALITVIYCDGEANAPLFADERHGKDMNSVDHLRIHTTVGCVYEKGLDIIGSVNNMEVYTEIQEGYCWDEDIELKILQSTEHPFVYKIGPGKGRSIWSDSDNRLALSATGDNTSNAYWNEFDTVTQEWKLSVVPEGYFTTTNFFTTNDKENQIIKVLGQSIYENSTQARRNIPNEINHLTELGNLPTPEFVSLYSFIIKHNTGVRDLGDGRNFVDSRSSKGYQNTLDALADGFLYSLSDKEIDVNIVVETAGAEEVIFADISAKEGGNLIYNLKGTDYTLDCTTGDGVAGAARIQIPEGTAEAARTTIVYIGYDANVGDISLITGTIYPTGDFAYVCKVSVQDVDTVDLDGPLSFIIARSEVDKSIAHVKEKLIMMAPEYYDGIDPLFGIVTNTSAEDDMTFRTTAGSIYTMSKKTFRAKDISIDGITVANASSNGIINKNDKIHNLNQLKEDAEGNAISDGDIALITVWGSMSDGGADKLFVNLPNDFYRSESDAKLDISGYGVSTIPREYKQDGFLIAKILVKYTSTNSGTWANILTEQVNVWDSVPLTTQNTSPGYPNNYPHNTTDTLTFTRAGASRIRLHIRDHHTEANYDFGTSRNGTDAFPTSVTARRTDARAYDDNLGAYTTATELGDTIRFQFTSDGSVSRKGYYIDAIEYETISQTGAQIIDLRGSMVGVGTGAGGVISQHNDLHSRDATDSHPINAITGLEDELVQANDLDMGLIIDSI